MMKRCGMTLMAALMVLALAACGGNNKKGIDESPGETLLWSSAKERPGWLYEEPDPDKGEMLFVGIGPRTSTEKLAISRAEADTRNRVVNYMGTLVKNKLKDAMVSFGLSSDVMDPTQSSIEYTEQLATNFVSRLKKQKVYIEKWQTETGIGYNAWVLMSVPSEALEKEHAKTAADMSRKAQQEAKERNDEIAKKQAEKVSDFWSKVGEEGLFD